ncbi:phosphodiester glycosidase family protein [candidate division KSB1 bacterium]|nr:phosphodiester glycosidase family protein [candidate division KSB1 bacterium]
MTSQRILALFISLRLLVSVVYGQYQYLETSRRQVGPGMIHFQYLESTQPWTINLLQVDLKNPLVQIETAKGKNLLAGLERTSSQAARHDRDGHTVVAAINGDFYSAEGIPINIQIAQGEILRNPIALSTIGFTSANRPVLNRVAFQGVVMDRKKSRAISGMNAVRATDQLILYNQYYGATSGTNQWGTEVQLRLLTPWRANDTLRCVVDSVAAYRGNMTIPRGQAVLSGHGAASDFLVQTVQPGDTLQMYLGISPGLPQIKALLGGFPRIVSHGQNYVAQGYREEGGPPHTYARHPRTAVGFSADSSTLFLVTVDGRQSTSAGMTLDELADFMIERGIHFGINLDGGGSTTMVVRGKITNAPSDPGGERSVANSLLVISTAFRDTLDQLEISPRQTRILQGQTLKFNITGQDRFYNPIPLALNQIELTVAPALGAITAPGTFVAGAQRDSGYIYFRCQHIHDSVYVVVKTITHFSLNPRAVVTDTLETVPLVTKIQDSDGLLPKITCQWRSTQPQVGSISPLGIFRGLHPGTTQIIAAYMNFSDTAQVRVEVGQGVVPIDSMENTSPWRLRTENVDPQTTILTLSDATGTFGKNSFKLQYGLTYNVKDNWVYLDTHCPIYGVPDSVWLDVKSDSAVHRFYFFVSDDNGELFKLVPRRQPRLKNEWQELAVDTHNPTAVTNLAEFHFPITLETIAIKLSSGNKVNQYYQGAVYLDYLRASYPLRFPTEVVEPGIEPPRGFGLYPNFPNPFNHTTSIKFWTAHPQTLELKLFDILGREAAVIFHGLVPAGEHLLRFDGSGLASGIYFLRINPPFNRTLKLVLLK